MSSAARYLLACCEPDTTSWAPRTYAQNVMANIQYAWGIGLKVCFISDNMCVRAKNLLVQFGACMHIPHTFPTRPSVYAGGIHAFRACVSTCALVCTTERQNKHFYNTYSCPYKPYDVCLPVGHQFYCGAHVRISIFLYPACISRWSAISPAHIAL